MGIAPTFGNGAVKAQVAAFSERVDRATVFMLQALGESLAAYAKEHRTYTDRTGNLTNSIGYAVARGKELVAHSGIDQPGAASEAAMRAVMQMIANGQNSYSVIVVAGMNYAAYVEAKGYNVLLPAELKARTDFPAAMARLTAMAKSKAREMFGDVL